MIYNDCIFNCMIIIFSVSYSVISFGVLSCFVKTLNGTLDFFVSADTRAPRRREKTGPRPKKGSRALMTKQKYLQWIQVIPCLTKQLPSLKREGYDPDGWTFRKPPARTTAFGPTSSLGSSEATTVGRDLCNSG